MTMFEDVLSITILPSARISSHCEQKYVILNLKVKLSKGSKQHDN